MSNSQVCEFLIPLALIFLIWLARQMIKEWPHRNEKGHGKDRDGNIFT